MKKFILFLLLTFVAKAETGSSVFSDDKKDIVLHGTVMIGFFYAPVVRIGRNTVEFGMMSSHALGFIKYYYAGRFMAGIGPALMMSTSKPGITGSVGFTSGLIGHWLRLRAEMNASASYDAKDMFSELQIGAGVHW